MTQRSPNQAKTSDKPLGLFESILAFDPTTSEMPPPAQLEEGDRVIGTLSTHQLQLMGVAWNRNRAAHLLEKELEELRNAHGLLHTTRNSKGKEMPECEEMVTKEKEYRNKINVLQAESQGARYFLNVCVAADFPEMPNQGFYIREGNKIVVNERLEAMDMMRQRLEEAFGPHSMFNVFDLVHADMMR